jgi:hypothetical protein
MDREFKRLLVPTANAEGRVGLWGVGELANRARRSKPISCCHAAASK